MRTVLADLGIDEQQQDERLLSVMNKADLLADHDPAREALGNLFDEGCFTSALDGDGIDALLAAIDARLGKERRTESLVLGPADGAARAWLHERGEVFTSRMGETGDETIEVAMDAADWARFGARWPALAG